MIDNNSVYMPDEFDFVSTINPFGVTYHARRMGNKFALSWELPDEATGHDEEKVTRMYHRLKRGDYRITFPLPPAGPATVQVTASLTNDLGHAFWLPVGDWSGDGHERSYEPLIFSNKPVEEVREAHFAIKEKLGFDIEAMCAEYGDDVPKREQWDALRALGVEVPEDPESVWTPDIMADCWLALLMLADPGLQLKYRREPEAQPLQFCGNDDKGRHIKTIGYGLFMV